MRATFPWQLLRQDVTPRFVGGALDTQRAVSGARTVVPTASGRWQVTCGFVVHGESAQLAWQAFLAQMEGQIGTTLVPICTRFRPRNRDAEHVTGRLATGFGLTDHGGFAVSPPAAVVVAEAAPLRATVLKVALLDSTGLRPGQYLSIGERLYRVQHQWREGGVEKIMVQPPLREAASAGATVETARPVCRMSLLDEDAGSFDQLLDRLPQVTATFVEAV